MEENRQQKEIVFTYRQTDQLEPVQLRYERDLPPCMLRREPTGGPSFADEEEEDYLAPWRSAIAPPEQPKKNRWGVRLFAGLSLLAGLVCLGVGIWYVGQYGWAAPGSQPADGGNIPPAEEYYWEQDGIREETTISRYPVGGPARLTLDVPAGEPLEPGEIYEKVNPSVVTVLGGHLGDHYKSVGTGVIFSGDGYILTNYHVISGCNTCDVWIKGPSGVESQAAAQLVGFDEEADLAVLKVESTGLQAAEFGISDDLRIGDTCYAIGNPLGVELHDTFTNGIISAANRSVKVDGVNMNLIQTNTALNSGNSGGPLINQYGQVVGINTIKMMSKYDTIEGLGFAIPTSQAERWVNELVMYGQTEPRVALGIEVQPVDRVFPDGFHGLLLVSSVTNDRSADRAGIRRGDYIISFNGQEVATTEEILIIRRWLSVGDEVPVRIYRNGKYLDLTVTMMEE